MSTAGNEKYNLVTFRSRCRDCLDERGSLRWISLSIHPHPHKTMATLTFRKGDHRPRVGVALRGDQPALVNWRGRTYLVSEVLDTHQEELRGWLRRGQRTHYRVATGAGELELCHEGAQWYLLEVLVDEPDEGEFWLGGPAQHELVSVKDELVSVKDTVLAAHVSA